MTCNHLGGGLVVLRSLACARRRRADAGAAAMHKSPLCGLLTWQEKHRGRNASPLCHLSVYRERTCGERLPHHVQSLPRRIIVFCGVSVCFGRAAPARIAAMRPADTHMQKFMLQTTGGVNLNLSLTANRVCAGRARECVGY